MDENRLYNLAFQCATNKLNGCKKNCATCMFNIGHYVPVNEAMLIRTDAEIAARRYHTTRRRNMVADILPLAVILVAALLIISSIHSCLVNPPKDILPTSNALILQTLKEVKSSIADVNADGKVDCIDYSILFKALYPLDTYLMINQNEETGMNHMFVAAQEYKDSQTYVYLEPQRTDAVVEMYDAWGPIYNPMKNKIAITYNIYVDMVREQMFIGLEF